MRRLGLAALLVAFGCDAPKPPPPATVPPPAPVTVKPEPTVKPKATDRDARDVFNEIMNNKPKANEKDFIKPPSKDEPAKSEPAPTAKSPLLEPDPGIAFMDPQHDAALFRTAGIHIGKCDHDTVEPKEYKEAKPFEGEITLLSGETLAQLNP